MKFVTLAAATLLAATPAFAQDARSSQEFLKEAIQGNNAEVEMGKLAAARGGSKEVRDFGKMLSTDHAKAGAEARKVAKQIKLTPPTGIPPEAQETKAKLEKLRGAEFDKEFAVAMVEDHEKDIAAYTEQATNGDDNRVKGMATKQLPTLKKHLDMAQKLAPKGQ